MESRCIHAFEPPEFGTDTDAAVIVHDSRGVSPCHRRITKQKEIRPEGTAQKPDPVNIKTIVLQNMNIRACAYPAKITDEFWYAPAIKLVVAKNTNNRLFREVFADPYQRRFARTDVTCQYRNI